MSGVSGMLLIMRSFVRTNPDKRGQGYYTSGRKAA